MHQKQEDVYKHKKLFKEEMRMKKKLKLITIIFIIMLSIASTNAWAYTVDTEARASIVFDKELPYHYEAEQKGKYTILQYQEGTTLYDLERNRTSVMTRFTNVEKYEDDILERILENGYPEKTVEELGVNSSNEAHFATQEAIYAYLENKDMKRYIAENEEGQRIIDCAGNILENAKPEEVIFTEIDTKWKVDENDESKRYKQYRISLDSKLESVNIALENAQDVQICDHQNRTVTEARNGDIVKIIVPKGMNQTFQVKLLYTKQGCGIYRIYNTSNTNLQYLLSVNENLAKEKIFEIDFQNLAPVIITNRTYETQEPMEGSVFTIFDSAHKPVRENLTTDEKGEIHTFLEQGAYLLSQIRVKDGYSPSGDVLNFEIKSLKEAKFNILNIKQTSEETKQEQTETNVVKEEQKIIENDINNITNIHQTNIEKEVTKQTNETNLEEKNEFINTIYEKHTNYATRNNVYENKIWKETVTNSVLPGRNQTTYQTKEEFQDYINRIKTAKLDVPILPVALKN